MSSHEWLERAHKNSAWLVALGILQIVFGVVILGAPLAGGLAVTLVIGMVMIFAGIARLVAAFAADSFGIGALAFLWGLLVVVTGFYIFTNPGVGLVTLTLVLSMLFFVNGLTECVAAFHVKPARGWGWMLTGGVVSILLAFMVWRQFPFSGIWLVGTLLGVNLLMSGMTTTMVGSAARTMTKTAA
jgi:uncharacterized membrane protein HdeD (DUF308 family)